MPIQLDGPRLAPFAGGVPEQLVIFLHGYGADGNDLIGLGREWARLLPKAAFVSPDAPETLPGGFFGGRQWFGLETRSEREWEEGVRRAQPALETFIAAETARLKLPMSAVALVGFSQGTMMALQTGLRLKEAPAASSASPATSRVRCGLPRKSSASRRCCSSTARTTTSSRSRRSITRGWRLPPPRPSRMAYPAGARPWNRSRRAQSGGPLFARAAFGLS